MNKFFVRLSSVTFEWVGENAEYYFNVILNDKPKYSAYIKALRDISSKLENDANRIEEVVSKNR